MNTFGRRGASALALGALFFAVGCSAQTVQDRSPEDSLLQTFNADFPVVFDAALSALRQMRFPVQDIVADDETSTISFTRPISHTQFGGVGRMIVTKSQTPPITVRLQYDRRVFFSGAAGEGRIAENLFGRMKREIDLARPSS